MGQGAPKALVFLLILAGAGLLVRSCLLQPSPSDKAEEAAEAMERFAQAMSNVEGEKDFEKAKPTVEKFREEAGSAWSHCSLRYGGSYINPEAKQRLKKAADAFHEQAQRYRRFEEKDRPPPNPYFNTRFRDRYEVIQEEVRLFLAWADMRSRRWGK